MTSEGSAPFSYHFEEIGADLERPPFAALRALQLVGILATPKGWLHLSLQERQTLAQEGHRERVDILAVRTIVNVIPANQIKLVSRISDTPATEVPAELLRALGPQRAIPMEEWSRLGNLDRFVLLSLSYNTRLLWKAIDELEVKGKLKRRRSAWAGAVARCELKMRSDVLVRLTSAEILEGRAFVLARSAGRRAARKVSEIFDLQSDTEVGPIELDWGLLDQPGGMLWQAHVSGSDGAFLPAASLQAATTAAITIFDIIKEIDPRATLTLSTITEEPWLVGNDGTVDATTRLYAKPPKSISTQEPPSSDFKRGGTLRLDTSPLSAVPSAAAVASSVPSSSPSTTPVVTEVTPPPPISSSKPVQRLATVPPRPSLEATVQVQRIKPKQSPLFWVALVVLGIAGAGMFGYMLGR